VGYQYLTRDLRTVRLFDLAYCSGFESSDDPDQFLSNGLRNWSFGFTNLDQYPSQVPSHGHLPCGSTCGSTSGGWIGIDNSSMRWDCPLYAVRPYLYWRNDGYFSLNLQVDPISGSTQLHDLTHDLWDGENSLLPSHGDLLDLFVRCSNGLYSSEDG
jgi:hypothetical protein